MIPQAYPLYAWCDGVKYVVVSWTAGTSLSESSPYAVAIDGSSGSKAVRLDNKGTALFFIPNEPDDSRWVSTYPDPAE